MRLLQRHCGIDRGRGAARAALGAEEREYPRFARAAEAASAGGTEAGERFEQGLGPGGMIQIFARAGTHAGHDAGRMRHVAVGEDADLLGGGANQFDGANGALGILRGNVDDHDFGARILQLAENRVGGSGRKSNMAEHRLSQARRFQTTLQRG